MSNYNKRFKSCDNFKLKEYPTQINNELNSNIAKDSLKKVRKKLANFQDIMYAHSKYNVLVCIQGMDTSGKDSLIRRVFQRFNSRGIVVQSFKVPTEKEYQHDFLWRHYLALPERGKFGVFNRTHYENVLISRVHNKYLLNEYLPNVVDIDQIPEIFWENRYESINNFEKHISENGTIIFKFYLHISKDEQKNRIMRRLDKENKNWKFSPSDITERQHWDDYAKYYEKAIQKTSKPNAPWYIIPADEKDTARYLVAQIMWEVLKKYDDIKYPELAPEIKENLHKYKQELEKE